MNCPHKHCPYNTPAQPTAGGAAWQAWHGRAEDILPGLPPESVDALISDPPYGSGGISPRARLRATSVKYRNTGLKEPLHDFDGDSLLPAAWEGLLAQVLRAAHPVIRPDGGVLLFCDHIAHPALQAVTNAAGFKIRGLLVWNKGRGARPFPNGFRKQSELIIWAQKPGTLKREPPVYLDGVFEHTTRTANKRHITEKPIGLMRELVELCPPGGTVLDPFQGAGTTGVAALQTGRRYIGIESVEHYHGVACERLRAAEAEAT